MKVGGLKFQYNQTFVSKIEKSSMDFKMGRYKKILTKDLWISPIPNP
jgi:hypothetical protein